jgi:hypothetical protein
LNALLKVIFSLRHDTLKCLSKTYNKYKNHSLHPALPTLRVSLQHPETCQAPVSVQARMARLKIKSPLETTSVVPSVQQHRHQLTARSMDQEFTHDTHGYSANPLEGESPQAFRNNTWSTRPLKMLGR